MASDKARGGVGLIVTEDQAVHRSGGSEPFVIQAYRDECVEPFRRITSAPHEHGAKMVAQLFHPASNFFPSREGIDTIVVSRGSKANDGLYKALKGKVKELYVIGQALAPRRDARLLQVMQCDASIFRR
jgi:2,4-dienoyl-CoA reductase-like NADH-dependent reductase (Old Yellow Enzyme family)